VVLPFPIHPVDVVGAGLVAALCLHLHAALYEYAFDDAYIHFRIAAHLARDGAPYYNSGEAVMASTAPAWTLLLAPLFAAQEDPRRLVATLNALFSTVAACVSVAVLRELTAGRLPRPVLWLLAVPYLSIVLPSSVGLMETALAMLLFSSALLLFLRERGGAFVLLGIVPFLRPELALFSAGLLAYAVLRRRGPAGRALAACALGALPLLAYELYFFGTVIPSGVEAKAVVYELSPAQVLAPVITAIAPPLPRGPVWLEIAIGLAGLAWLLAAAVQRVTRGFADEADRIAHGLLFGGLALAAAYVAARAFVFPWYTPLFAWPITLGFCAIVSRTTRPVGAAALLALVVAPHALRLEPIVTASLGDPLGYAYFAENARVRKYLEVGRRLYRRYPDARLLSSEIGGLGYGFGGRVLDGVGLVSPEALHHHPMAVPGERSHGATGAIPVGFVRETRPELIVSLDVFIEAFLRSEARRAYVRHEEPIYVEEDLRLAASPSLWRSRALNVFIRRDLAPGFAPTGPASNGPP